ncbi:hypothetical protein SEA_MOOSEHEAD_54 [Gordonia phage Moosehead]|nr:hypothetical protein SEA_MOOSEHEAD_54 [Gordonia phage Moosehead]
MIDLDTTPARYRGTIEVYIDNDLWLDGNGKLVESPEWRWRCKSNNHTILASGQGYSRRAGALNAIDAMFSRYEGRKPRGERLHLDLAAPWRLVIHDRHGNTTTGAVY